MYLKCAPNTLGDFSQCFATKDFLFVFMQYCYHSLENVQLILFFPIYLKFNLQSYSIFNSLLRILFMAMNSSEGQSSSVFKELLQQYQTL